MKYTKEQKDQYFKDLRARWKASKEMADKDETAKALYREVGGQFSYYSFYFTLMDMKRLNYDGVPYVDCKTFNGWLDSGFRVKKGEKSRISGIVWIHPMGKNEKGEKVEVDESVYPKVYHLFHKSQVEERKQK
jgi:hypothetical protein